MNSKIILNKNSQPKQLPVQPTKAPPGPALQGATEPEAETGR